MPSSDETRAKIDRTRAYLLGSTLNEDTKDGLGMLLDAAGAAVNGTTDKLQAIADAILALALHEVRQAVRFPNVVDAIVKRHEVQCPAASGWKGIVIRCAWPLALVLSVAFASPNFQAIATIVSKFWK